MSGQSADPAVVGMKALEQAFLDYREQGLRLPPVPRPLIDQLTYRVDDVYTTTPMSLDDPDALIALADDPDAAAEMGFGQIGHGIASWYFCVRLLVGPLAVYLRLNYGGAYGDAGAERERVNGTLLELEELVVAAAEARVSGKLPAGERLLIVDDVLGERYFRIGRNGEPVESLDPVTDALERMAAA